MVRNKLKLARILNAFDPSKGINAITARELMKTPDTDEVARQVIPFVLAEMPQPKDGKDSTVPGPKGDKGNTVVGPPGKDGENGKDADETAIVAKLEDDLPRFGSQFRDGLELLEGEERLKIEAVLGLSDELASLRRELQKKANLGAGGAVMGRELVRAYDLSSSLDGTTTTFQTPGMWRVISIHLSSFPNALRENVDFTWTPTSVAFTNQITPATSLAAGQTCVIVYMSA